jgi:hypothetical protein
MSARLAHGASPLVRLELTPIRIPQGGPVPPTSCWVILFSFALYAVLSYRDPWSKMGCSPDPIFSAQLGLAKLQAQ